MANDTKTEATTSPVPPPGGYLASVRRKNIWAASFFLAPNFLGFLTFVAFPVVFSLVMAFTDWTFQRGGTIQFVGLRNFYDLMLSREFWYYLGNTVFLMLAIPVSIAGSLFLAVLLSQRLKGIVLFRTLCYLPHFTAGVALYILWKALYNPEFGPINQVLRPLVAMVESFGRNAPRFLVYAVGGLLVLLGVILFLLAMFWAFNAWREMRRTRLVEARLRQQELALSARHAGRTLSEHESDGIKNWANLETIFVGLIVLLLSVTFFGAIAFIPILAGQVILQIPDLAPSVQLDAPKWLSDANWAKPAIMLMGVWGGIGGNNMLLYIAGISNISPELYEAAEIDGAGAWDKFRFVTWPQLAPTTFFIVVMSLIGGLQGGFEQARVMTEGGPAGATTTLSYYIYRAGFELREMGHASAVAWVLFIMIFLITALNWRFGKGGHGDAS